MLAGGIFCNFFVIGMLKPSHLLSIFLHQFVYFMADVSERFIRFQVIIRKGLKFTEYQFILSQFSLFIWKYKLTSNPSAFNTRFWLFEEIVINWNMLSVNCTLDVRGLNCNCFKNLEVMPILCSIALFFMRYFENINLEHNKLSLAKKGLISIKLPFYKCSFTFVIISQHHIPKVKWDHFGHD